MIKLKDEIKVIEKGMKPHGKKLTTTIGEVVQITKHTITINRLVDGKKTWLISFNISDFVEGKKKFFIKNNGEWEELDMGIKVNLAV